MKFQDSFFFFFLKKEQATHDNTAFHSHQQNSTQSSHSTQSSQETNKRKVSHHCLSYNISQVTAFVNIAISVLYTSIMSTNSGNNPG